MPMFEATIKTTDPMTVAFLVMHGPYSQTPKGYSQLYGWLGEQEMLPIGMPISVFFTQPDQVPEADALWEIRAPVASNVPTVEPDESGLGVKRVNSILVASAMYKGPYSSMEPTYQALKQWIAENGYELNGPPEEVYYSDPAEVPSEEYLTEIRWPVKEK